MNSENNAPRTERGVTRRDVLKTAGVCITLPWFESARIARGAGTIRDSAGVPPMRLVLSWHALGFHTPNLFPQQTGRDYEPSRYLKHFDGLRDKMTVISRLYQDGRRGGHGLKSYAWRGVPEGNYLESVDVYAGRQIGGANRFPNLSIYQAAASQQQSFAANGVAIASFRRASQVFNALFVEDSGAARAEAMTRIRQGHSILDKLRDQASAQKRQLNAADTQKLDQYLEAIRQSERDLKRQEEWAAIPKPTTTAMPPQDVTEGALFIPMQRQMYDMIYLALLSDSTRVVGNILYNNNVVPRGIDGVDGDHQVLTHHGMVPEKIQQLSLIEDEEMKVLAGFLKKLRDTPEGDGSMLDHTMVCVGSESNDLSRHAGEEVPILLAGGGLQHGQFLKKETLVQNLYLTLLHKLGLEKNSWANSTGTISELG
jgi:hypothetical protein